MPLSDAPSRPTNWTELAEQRAVLRRSPDPSFDDVTLRSLDDELDEVELLLAQGLLEVSSRASGVRPVVETIADPEPSATAALEEELTMAREAIAELRVHLEEEIDRRRELERELVACREIAEMEAERRLEEMSRSYHDTLAALRRAYEERLRKLER